MTRKHFRAFQVLNKIFQYFQDISLTRKGQVSGIMVSIKYRVRCNLQPNNFLSTTIIITEVRKKRRPIEDAVILNTYLILTLIGECFWHICKCSHSVAAYIQQLQIFICSINKALKNFSKENSSFSCQKYLLQMFIEYGK